MLNPTETSDALKAAGLGRLSQELAGLLRPSVRMTSHRRYDFFIGIGRSKLGGSPDLPATLAWPQSSATNEPLAFVAQLCLADLYAQNVSQQLPPTGWLWFFYDTRQQHFGDQPTDRGNWQVLFYNGEHQTLRRHHAPATLPSTAHFVSCVLTFASEWTLPLDPTLELPTLGWTAEERTIYEQFQANYPSPAEHTTLHHRLLGYPETLQDDMRAQCQLMAHGVSSIDDPRATPLLQNALDWQLLLQVDSDEQAAMRWGNNGLLYFWIERSALQNRQFDQVWCVLQSE